MRDELNLPSWINSEAFIEALLTKKGDELYALFRCNNSSSFTTMMKKLLPNKPTRVGYAEYIKSFVEGTDPRVQQAETVEATKVEPVKASKPFMKVIGGEESDPSIQQAEVVKPTAKSFMFMKPKEEEKVPEAEHVPQPRIRTEDDIWESKQLFKDAGRTHQNEWLRNHPDPLKETVDAPYAEADIFTRNS